MALIALSVGAPSSRAAQQSLDLHGFGTSSKWHEIFCVGSEIPFGGDFNGDGSDDILTKLANGTKYVAFFSLRQSFQRQPTDDPDGDGSNNFAEYAMSSNPALATEPGTGVSHGFRTLQPSGNRQFYMQWPMVTGNPIVGYQLDCSWDLRNWHPVTILQSIPAADPDFNWLRGYCDPDPVHDRAFLQLRFIKTNEP